MAFLRMEPTVSGSPYGRKAFASGPGGRSVDSVNPYAKHVPRAALGKDVARIRRIGLELAPQPHDLRVDRTVVDVVAVQAGHVEELVARKNAIRRPEENYEEAELAVAEPHRLPVAALQAARVEVELPTVETVGTNALRAALMHLGTAAAQHGAYPCEQLAWAERFGQIVVCAQFQPHHPVSLFAATGEHDDRDRGLVTQPARECHPVLGLELEVEDHQVHHFVSQHRLHRPPVG